MVLMTMNGLLIPLTKFSSPKDAEIGCEDGLDNAVMDGLISAPIGNEIRRYNEARVVMVQ